MMSVTLSRFHQPLALGAGLRPRPNRRPQVSRTRVCDFLGLAVVTINRFHQRLTDIVTRSASFEVARSRRTGLQARLLQGFADRAWRPDLQETRQDRDGAPSKLARRVTICQPPVALQDAYSSNRLCPRRCARDRYDRGGVSLLEVVLVLTVIGILVSMSAPSFHRTIQQSHADVSGANLSAIWTAQRLYWLENHSYANDLTELENVGLLDPTIVAGTARYSYAVTSADDSTFTATATRTGSTRWSGQFEVHENGVLSGAVQASGQNDIVPGFQ